jgi:homoserine kinase type II
MSATALLSPDALSRLLAEHWGLSTAEITAHHGGMSSLTWVVTQGSQRWLAKAVSADRDGPQFAAGLAAATRLSAAGIPAGAPVPTREGTPIVESDGAALALLAWVEGSPIEQHTTEGMRLVGRTLARAHLALGKAPAQPHIAPALDPAAPHLWIRPWIRPALAAARAAVEALGPETLTWGPLHADPGAEAFLADSGSGTVGLIDWGAYTVGPRVFDLAYAVLYAGGPQKAQPLISAYLAEEALSAAEVERALGAMLGWCWATQAYYCAQRIAACDTTGVADPADNEQGLANAKSHLDPAHIRDYQPADEARWTRSRVVSFLDTCYFDAVEARKPAVGADSVIHMVAVDDDQIVGILDVALRGDLATIETVCVHPDYRRYGIATRLLREAVKRLEGSPARTLDAWTRQDPAALAWYSASGFVEEYTYLHAYSGYGPANALRMAEPREPFRPVIIFAHADREHEQRVRSEFERVYVCRRLVRDLTGDASQPS